MDQSFPWRKKMKKINTNLWLTVVMGLAAYEGKLAPVRGEKSDREPDSLEPRMARPEPSLIAPPGGRNATCPCGSGKKFKKCCRVQKGAK